MQWIIVLAIVIAAVVFAVQNAAPVSIAFFNWRLDASLAIVAILCFACGALVGALLLLPGEIRRRLALRRQRDQIAELESVNAGLRRALISSGVEPPAAPASDR
ncbi:MAG: LapA family protein [Steroidobacteraceae bacterium]